MVVQPRATKWSPVILKKVSENWPLRGLVKILEKCSENPFKCHLFKFKQKQHSSGLESSLYWYQVQAHIRPNVIPCAMTIFSKKADF